ncbi:MAG TPA: SPOR domain-containing protein [Chryseosolibacter sp.]
MKLGMKSMMRLIAFVFTLVVVAACSSKVTTTGGGSSSGKYSEDLSVLRPKIDMPSDTGKQVQGTSNAANNTVYLEPRHTVNAQLDAVLDSIDRINLANGMVDGFTIQLYSGKQQDEALNVKKQVAQAMPELDADIQFSQPNFRVRAGKYINRFEAQKDYLMVKKLFPNAILIPERIPIR